MLVSVHSRRTRQPEQELLDAMIGDGAKDLSTKDLNGFRQNPIKWLRDKTGLN